MISPGLYFNEMDFTQYATALGGTTVCLLGGASKGPVNKPVLVSNEGSYVQQFGPPLLTDYGGQAAVQFLRKGSRLLYVRIASGAATSSRTLPGTTGGTAAVPAAGTITFASSVNPADAVTVTIGDGTISKVFEIDSNGAIVAGHIGVIRGSSSAATMSNLLTAINNSPLNITAVDSTSTVPQTTLANRTGGTAGNVSITTGGGATSDFAVTGMATGAAAIAGSGGSVLTMYAASPGTWGNGLSVKVIHPSVIPGVPAADFDLEVYGPSDPGAPSMLQERFRDLSLDPASARFIETALANGIANESPASRFVTADALTTGTPDAATYALGTGGGAVGADGISGIAPSDYVGTVSGQHATGLRAVGNAETSEYNVIAIPGVTHATVVAALIAHVEQRRDCWALIDTPLGLSSDQGTDWVDGLQPAGVPNSPATALSSSFASAFGPWVQVYDPYNKKNIWLPPSAFVAGLAVDTDRLYGAWYPVAGSARGVIQGALDIEYSPDQTMRDRMVGDGFLNPLVKYPEGIEVAGNKTLQRTASPTQSIHVRRMLIHAYKLIASSARYVVWDPNDSTTWRKLEQLCNVPLSQIAAARGLDEFTVAFNASTNPPESRARREVHGKLVIKPRDVAESIVIDTAVTSDGAIFGDDALSTVSGVGT